MQHCGWGPGYLVAWHLHYKPQTDCPGTDTTWRR